jgi:hypothetical protein
MAVTNTFYTGLRDGVALQLLQQFGFKCAVQVKSGEVFDPVQGIITTPATWFVFPAYGVYGGGNTGKSSGNTKSTDGNTLARVVKKEVYLDASVLTIAPSPDDLFQDENGDTFEILSVQDTNPGGVTVLWKLIVAR